MATRSHGSIHQTYDLKVTAKLALQKIIDEIEPRDPRDNGNSYALGA
jgi:hypothetical protein